MPPQPPQGPIPSVWPVGDGEIPRLLRELDWAATPLGPVGSWPPHLHASVELVLTCGFPSTLLWGPDLLLIYNDAYRQVIGHHHPLVFGRPLSSIPGVIETFRAFADRVRAGETVLAEDILYRYSRDGEPEDFWFTFSYSPIRDATGNVAGILAIGLETTARILAERAKTASELAIQRSEQRLKRVLETDAVGVIFFNYTGTVIDANQVFLDLTGYSRDDIAAGLHWRHLTPPEYVAVSEEQMQRFVQTGRIGPYEKQYIHKDGSRSWMLFAGRDLGDGTIAEYCIDISDRKRAEDALNQSERYFRALVSATSDVVFRMNADWTEMRQLRGSGFLSDTNSPNRDWLNLYIHPEDHARVLEAIRLAIDGRQIFHFEHRFFHADGTLGWTFSRAVPLLDDAGHITEWFGAATDITVRKRAETGVRESEKLAVVGRLASSIAHEINNPLEAVINLIYLAQNDASPQSLEYLNQAQLELARVTHIATETLRFNRRNTRVSATHIESVITLHEGRLRAAHITVERRFHTHPPVFLFANELRQVIANLVGNAIDAMHELPVRRLLLRIHSAHDPHTGVPGVRFTVADTGAGMTPETLRRLYEPFFTTKEATGTGLGLWVAHEIVRKHHGAIHVRSRAKSPRTGTVFSIFLPHQQPQPSQELEATPAGLA